MEPDHGALEIARHAGHLIAVDHLHAVPVRDLDAPPVSMPHDLRSYTLEVAEVQMTAVSCSAGS